ncbi:MAG: phytanoyl-CoA dioxygenase family protein [Phycisphaeraceae bacterium]
MNSTASTPSPTSQACFSPQILTASQRRDYEAQGYLLLPGVLTAEGLTRLRDQCMAAWHGQKGEYDPEGSWLKNALLCNIHHHAPLVRDFYFRGPLVDVAQQIIGPNIKAATSQLTFKMRGNTKAFGWHQDNGYGQLEPATAITTLTALEDNDPDNGCLWLIPGSHLQGQINVSDRLTPEAKAAGKDLSVDVPDESGAIPMPMKAGDTLIMHCHTLHQSEGNFSTTRDRRVLFLRYADADAVETYNENKPRLGRLLRGRTRFAEVEAFEKELE